MTIPESMERGVDLVSDYPTCAYLFRSLRDPTNLQMMELVGILTSLRPSRSIGDALGVLARLSQYLKEMEEEQATSMVKPLKSKPIFPVSMTMDTLSSGKFDRMVSANNKNWYIDDTNEFHRCFGGKIALLATSPTFLPRLASLLTALNLDSRKLSRIATRGSSPTGRQRFLAETTAFLRRRYPFLKS